MKLNSIFRRSLLAAAVFVLPVRALALTPDEIALVVNSAEPAGKELAQFYAAQRHIPDNRIIELDNVPKTDEMSTRDFEESVIPQIREFLKSGNLTSRIKCLVTFYGVPLRIAARVDTPDEVQELGKIRQILIRLPERVAPAVKGVEAVAIKLDPSFTPASTGDDDLDELRRRCGVAARSVTTQLGTIPDPKHRSELAGEFYSALVPLLGKAMDIQKRTADLQANGTTQPSDLQPVQAAANDLNKLAEDAGRLEYLPYDAQARKNLRDSFDANFGLLRYVQLLKDQADYLNPDQSGASFDSELAMAEWPVYQHRAWIPNPLYYQSKMVPHSQTLMVTRLDAPTADLVKSIINTSIKVEQNGLKGKVVIDSLGVKPGEEKAEQRGYGIYDQYLRNLDELLRRDTRLEVMLDEKPDVLPAGSATDVALYCGWHSARNYIPACKFNPGAVGYHIASYELISLRGPNETGWVHGLLTDGVCGTIGPVAEPFLGSFPRPDEFFPLLLTGKLTLAETYWKTVPWGSWMQSCVGDPMYTPYKNNPQLHSADLPFRLRAALPKTAAAPEAVKE